MPFSLSAPAVLEEDELAEREGLTEQERAEIENDLYGASVASLKETETMLRKGLDMVEAAIAMISPDSKEAYLDALDICPGIVERESDPRGFLRCENYDVWAAAKRLVAYWTLRKSLFGPSRAYLPMTLQGAMAEDIESLKKGVIEILPVDKNGRYVMFFNRIRAVRPIISPESLVICLFYHLHLIRKMKIFISMV
jgi:hypothetical protein